MNHLSETQLTSIYFEEASLGEGDHLRSCPACQAAFGELKQFLDALRATPVPDSAPGLESRMWAKISPRVQENLARRRPRFRFLILAPVFAGLLALAFLGGMYTHKRMAPEAGPISAKSRERVLLIALGDHLDRSQIVLAELVNAPEGQPADLSAEQQIAGDLVAQNRILRQTALRSGDTVNAAVLDDLERILLAIKHAPPDASEQQVQDLRNRVEAEGLLFKIRVVSSNVREKGMKL